jgi:hypothetical protein
MWIHKLEFLLTLLRIRIQGMAILVFMRPAIPKNLLGLNDSQFSSCPLTIPLVMHSYTEQFHASVMQPSAPDPGQFSQLIQLAF